MKDHELTYLEIYYVCSTVYTVQIGRVKIAFALFYRRISPARWWQWSVNALLGFIGCFTIALALISIFACDPVAKSWDLTILTGSCLDRNPIYLSITSTHVFFDVILIALPIPVILGLQMGTGQKVALIFVFALGGSYVSSINVLIRADYYRTVVSSPMRLTVLVPMLNDPDQTWAMTEALLWMYDRSLFSFGSCF